MTRPRKFTPFQEQTIFELWLSGWQFLEIATTQETSRQLIRDIVLRFNPTPEQYAEHERNFRK